ncbi:ABC transporter permease [Pollutibacter soli]|uniref:ABC transporter permease n=1 Tax=Pollutibacter soli TaxID=3034157 RepID=UPI0030135946
MISLVRIELFKIFRKPRTYISFAAVIIIIWLIQLGFYAEGEKYLGFSLQGMSESFLIEGKILNGFLVCFIILQTLLVHIPLLVALVAGDMVSGEANQGTLRMLLTRPVSRTKLLISKFIAATMYTIGLLIWLAIWSLFFSLFIFGKGDMLIMKSDVVTQILSSDALWRYFAAFCFATLAMITVTSLAFLLSVFASNSIGPIIATMAVVVLFTIIQTLDLPLFNAVKPFLFTTHMLAWKGFFDVQMNEANEQIVGSIQDMSGILWSGAILAVHILFFLGVAIFIFRRKDILT